MLEEALELITRFRCDGTHLHSITNSVAQNFTANVLLACGASVSMTANPHEIEAFVGKANGLHINLGTLDTQRESAIRKAVKAANVLDIPVVLDPVMVHRSPIRLEVAKELLNGTGIVKCNRLEAEALAINSAANCLVKTGEIDTICFRNQKLHVKNGTPMLASTIATGLSLIHI